MIFEQFDHRKSRQEGTVNTKSRHLIVMNQLKKKEENWNNRFYVPIVQKNESVEKQQHQRINIYAKLTEVQDYYGIPEFHRQLFLMCLQTLPKVNQAIQFEIEEMNQKKSHIQLCMQAVEAREKCLSILLNHIHMINENPGDEQLISKSAEFITHLRILSINVVEQIIGWRQYLMKFLVNIHKEESISLPYTYYRENYLIKMKKDVQYIQNSILSQYYAFSNKSDPFFVAITKTAEDQSKIVQFISKPLLKRIKNCETIIQEETTSQSKEEKSVHNQINSKDQIKLSPEKQIQPGRLRPPKRPDQSQNQKRPVIKQLDPNDFTNQTQNSVQKHHIRPPVKPGDTTPQHQSSLKATNESNKKEAPDSHQKQPSELSKKDITDSNKKEKLDSNKKEPIKKPEIEQPALPQQTTERDNETARIRKCNLQDPLVRNYLDQINEDFKKSWRGELSLMQQQHDQQDDSFCVGIYQQRELLALGQCFMDTSLQERRLMLSHFSTKDPSQFQELLKELLNFIWEVDACAEIRMSLYHYIQNEQFQANKELTTKLKELGFKWKVVQSVSSEIRFTVMAIRRPADKIQPKVYDPIFLQHLYLSQETPVEEKNYFYSLVCLVNLGKQLQLKDDQVNDLKNALVKIEYQFKGIKSEQQSKEVFHNYVSEFFESYEEVQPYIDYQNLPEQVVSSFCKECYRWSKVKLAQQNGMIYNHFRVEPNADHAKTFMSESGDRKVYLISTDQSSTSVFIFEYQQEITVEKISQVLSQCSSQVPIDQNLYVPQFVVNAKTQAQENVAGAARFSTAYHPKMVDVPEIMEGVVIKAPFIFGIINEDFNEITNLPNLFFKVEQEQCLQIS